MILLTQLKSLAEFSEVISEIKNVGTVMDLSAAASSVLEKELGKLSAEQILAKLSSEGLTNAQIAQSISTYATDKAITKLCTEEAVATASTNALTFSEGVATGATTVFGTAVQGLGIKLKALATAHPALLAITAIASVIVGGITLWNKYGDTLENAKKKLEETEKAYEDAKNTLSEYNDELKTNKERIEELQGKVSKGTITIVEEAELEKLKKKMNY